MEGFLDAPIPDKEKRRKGAYVRLIVDLMLYEIPGLLQTPNEIKDGVASPALNQELLKRHLINKMYDRFRPRRVRGKG